MDKAVDIAPSMIWPWARWVYYLYAAGEYGALLFIVDRILTCSRTGAPETYCCVASQSPVRAIGVPARLTVLRTSDRFP